MALLVTQIFFPQTAMAQPAESDVIVYDDIEINKALAPKYRPDPEK